MAASAACDWAAEGSYASSRQLTLTRPSSPGPRARTSGGAPAVGCGVDTARKANERRLARVAQPRRKHWGWGWEHQQPAIEQLRAGAPALAGQLGVPPGDVAEPVALDAVELAPPR